MKNSIKMSRVIVVRLTTQVLLIACSTSAYAKGTSDPQWQTCSDSLGKAWGANISGPFVYIRITVRLWCA